MLDYLLCSLLCAIDHLKYVIAILIILIVYNKETKHSGEYHKDTTFRHRMRTKFSNSLGNMATKRSS